MELGHSQEGSSPRAYFKVCHPQVGTLSHQTPFRLSLLLVLSINKFKKKFLLWFFCWAWLAWALKISHCPFKGPLGVFCWFVLLNLKNFEELILAIMNILCNFCFHVFKLETFINTGLGKFIVNFVNRVDKTNHLLRMWVLKHDDDHRELVSPNLQCMDGHFLHKVLVFVLNEIKLYQNIMSKHEPRPPSQYTIQ